jgi:hypothetical protein
MGRKVKRDDRQLMQVEPPEPLRDKAGQEFGMLNFVDYLINTQPQFNSDKPGLQSSTRIEVAMTGRKQDSPLRFEWRDLERIIEAAEKPRNGYPIGPARKILPFIDSLECAIEVDEDAAPLPPPEPAAPETPTDQSN